MGKYSLSVLLLILFLSACSSEKSSGCTAPPKGFSQSDLIGTWGGSVKTAWDSTIIIRGDGQYKQIMHIKTTGFNFESDWRPWRITYSEQGLPLLHLEGLLMCAYWDWIGCSEKELTTPFTVGDTKDPFANESYWYDYCQAKWVDTPGEGVFMVLGVPARFDQPPRGINLVPFTKSAAGTSGPSYELKEP